MITLSHLKNSSIASIASVSVDSLEFKQYCNDAVRMLSEMGQWWATVRVLRGHVYDSRMVWPKNVASVLSVRTCKHILPIKNRWYQFSDEGFSTFSGVSRKSQSVVEFTGTSPVFRSFEGTTGILRFKVTNPADIGKTVTVYGLDENGSMLVKELVLTEEGADSPPLKFLEHIAKQTTIGEVLSFWHQPGSGLIAAAGVYRPNDLAPEYMVSEWRNAPSGSAQITALCKLSFEPMESDTDISLIDCVDAIKEMIQGIKKREAGDIEGGIAHEKEAVRRLNNQLSNRVPDDQFVASIEEFGGATQPFYNIR